MGGLLWESYVVLVEALLVGGCLLNRRHKGDGSCLKFVLGAFLTASCATLNALFKGDTSILICVPALGSVLRDD